MSALPKVPPANRSPKGPQNLKDKRVQGKEVHQPIPENLEEQGQTANTYQNTHHQGHQQDR